MSDTINLMHGDCLERMREIPDGSVDAVITDPPYGISLQPQRRITKPILGDGDSEARALWGAAIPELHRMSKDNTAHLLFTRWSEEWVKPLLAEFFTVKSCIVWVKNNFGIGYYTRPQWEMAFYCHKGKPPKPAKAISDVWKFPRVHRPIHSCEKPVSMMEYAVEFCAPAGGVVIDPFMGVGTTGVACVNTGRRFIGIEKDDKYFQLAKDRIEQARANAESDLLAVAR